MDLKLDEPDSARAEAAANDSSLFSLATVAATKPPEPGDMGLTASLYRGEAGGLSAKVPPSAPCVEGSWTSSASTLSASMRLGDTACGVPEAAPKDDPLLSSGVGGPTLMSGAAAAAAGVAGEADPLRTHVVRGARHDCGDKEAPPPTTAGDLGEDAPEPAAPAADDASLTWARSAAMRALTWPGCGVAAAKSSGCCGQVGEGLADTAGSACACMHACMLSQ